MEKSRARLTLRVTRQFFAHYPQAWRVEELVLAFGQPKRTIQRIIADMLTEGLIEKHYNAYRLKTELVTRLYGARWYLKTEMEKETWLGKK